MKTICLLLFFFALVARKIFFSYSFDAKHNNFCGNFNSATEFSVTNFQLLLERIINVWSLEVAKRLKIAYQYTVKVLLSIPFHVCWATEKKIAVDLISYIFTDSQYQIRPSHSITENKLKRKTVPTRRKIQTKRKKVWQETMFRSWGKCFVGLENRIRRNFILFLWKKTLRARGRDDSCWLVFVLFPSSLRLIDELEISWK